MHWELACSDWPARPESPKKHGSRPAAATPGPDPFCCVCWVRRCYAAFALGPGTLQHGIHCALASFAAGSRLGNRHKAAPGAPHCSRGLQLRTRSSSWSTTCVPMQGVSKCCSQTRWPLKTSVETMSMRIRGGSSDWCFFWTPKHHSCGIATHAPHPGRRHGSWVRQPVVEGCGRGRAHGRLRPGLGMGPRPLAVAADLVPGAGWSPWLLCYFGRGCLCLGLA